MQLVRSILAVIGIASLLVAARAPKEGAVLASLEGIPPCMGKCFISEAHFAWPYDLWDKDLKEWCGFLWGDHWVQWHLEPCARFNCPKTDFIRQATRAWRKEKKCRERKLKIGGIGRI